MDHLGQRRDHPGVFLGAEATTKFGDSTLSALLRGGVSVHARDIGKYWFRNLYFEEEFDAQPSVSVGAKAVYQVTGRVNLFLAGNFDRYFRRKGDMREYYMSTRPREVGFFKDSAGMDLYALTLSAGFKLTF
ncbi:omptin family outer membrane protease [Rhizobium calliandrae]|uniref:Omptin family outer membrane protease n=1 Tax=Rhizobium calliandrae TaxID=1312182 RepID=A0ABT7KJS6_9HYPH|nr:omptin family outer membrane protease [Rhizobium calliandrae]MDL2408260.1 omptin family outer membrane protease [Rhizobium calliandrae]